ncbi:MAG: class I SAM-dependent methyltransferase [Patescibacteria group bacterium]|nr:class I SAM-dependent methyltransferase [Patescibacteria group bacterium]
MASDFYQRKSREQKEYYNNTAQSYDRWHVETPSAKIVDAWNFSNLKKFLGNKKVERSLELGSGTGRLANNLLSLSHEAHGVDQSEEVLKIARRKYPALKLTCAEVVNLPYPDNFFDLVVINGSLHHFFAVEKTLAEAGRVLKSGGKLAILGEPSYWFFRPYNPFFYFWVINRLWAKLASFFKKKKQESEEIEPEAESYSPLKLKKQIKKADFQLRHFYTYDYFKRSESGFWLRLYPAYLKLENRLLAKIFPYFGQAIQVFASKK